MIDQKPKIITFLFVFKISKMTKDIGNNGITRNITHISAGKTME